MSTIIIDSGGTSSDWAIVDHPREPIQFTTLGLNPVTANVKEIISHTIQKHQLTGIKQIYMYGAGCSTPELNLKVQQGLDLMGDDIQIQINTDLLGAAYALCGNEPGIVSILGTGSNTAVFDGDSFIQTIHSGGYLLGDEGSGFEIGREVIIRYLRQDFPKGELSFIEKKIGLTSDDIINTVYTVNKPNHLLASYASVLQHLSEETKHQVLVPLFTTFIKKRILPFQSHLDKGIFFSGSIAFHYQKELSAALNSVNLHPRKIISKPIEALINYHTG